MGANYLDRLYSLARLVCIIFLLNLSVWANVHPAAGTQAVNGIICFLKKHAY
eukprot:SAG31_NODE_189_length_20842_cov_12.518151_16_plen_52_part_00